MLLRWGLPVSERAAYALRRWKTQVSICRQQSASRQMPASLILYACCIAVLVHRFPILGCDSSNSRASWSHQQISFAWDELTYDWNLSINSAMSDGFTLPLDSPRSICFCLNSLRITRKPNASFLKLSYSSSSPIFSKNCSNWWVREVCRDGRSVKPAIRRSKWRTW